MDDRVSYLGTSTSPLPYVMQVSPEEAARIDEQRRRFEETRSQIAERQASYRRIIPNTWLADTTECSVSVLERKKAFAFFPIAGALGAGYLAKKHGAGNQVIVATALIGGILGQLAPCAFMRSLFAART